MAKDIFDRLSAGRPPPIEQTIEQPRRNSPAEKLLEWLVNHWDQATVTARAIRIYGPYAVRDKQTTLLAAKLLVEEGWLIPVGTHRRDKLEWKIIRRLPQLTSVATVAGQKLLCHSDNLKFERHTVASEQPTAAATAWQKRT